MTADASGAVAVAPTQSAGTGTPGPDRWGTSTLFERLTRADRAVAAYWVATVARPAHRLGHPLLNQDCPGCRYELAVTAVVR